MKKRSVLLSLVILVLVTFGANIIMGDARDTSWKVKGTWTDACCCNVSCPCFFGNKPTEGFCEGSSLIEIETGHYGDVKLDNVSLVTTYRVGKWGKIYVSDTATKEQIDAIRSVLPKAIPFMGMGEIKKVEAVKLQVKRENDVIRYSVPETTVEIAPVIGANGKVINLENLPASGGPFPHALDHKQHKSKLLEHKSAGEKFSWSGRNAFVSALDLSGVDE